MSETALAHPLVADYLRQFDAAASVLPVLRGLGAVRVLVAEAVATTGKRSWASRLGWKGWALIGAALLVVAAVSGYYIRINSVGSLLVEGSFGWWYPPDYNNQVTTEADM